MAVPTAKEFRELTLAIKGIAEEVLRLDEEMK